jgi:hypothetical protein
VRPFAGVFFAVPGFLAVELAAVPVVELVEVAGAGVATGAVAAGAVAAGSVVDCAARAEPAKINDNAIADERYVTAKPENGEDRPRILPLYAELDETGACRESPA